jgi:hypothetical protein
MYWPTRCARATTTAPMTGFNASTTSLMQRYLKGGRTRLTVRRML